MNLSESYKIGKYKLDIYSSTRKILKKISNINIETVASKYIEFLSKLPKEDLKKLARDPKYQSRYSNLPNPKIDLINQLAPIYEELWSSMLDVGINHYLLGELVSTGAVDESTVAALVSDNLSRIATFETASEAEIAAIRELQTLRERLRLDSRTRRAFNLSPLYSGVGDLTLQQRMSYLETALKVNNRYKRQQAVKETFLLSKYMKNRYRVLANYSADSIDSNIRTYVSEYITERRLTDRVVERTALDALQLKENIARELRDRVDEGSRTSLIAKTEISLGYNIGKLMAFTSPEDMQRRMVWRNDFEKENTSPYYEICDYCSMMNGRTYTVAQLIKVAAVPPEGLLNYGKKGGNKTEFKNELYPVIVAHPGCFCFWEVVDTPEDQALREKQYKRTKVLKAVGITALATLGITTGLVMARKNVYGTLLKSIIKTNNFKTTGAVYNQAADGITAISRVLGANASTGNILTRLAGR